MATYFVKTATITGGSAPSDGNDGLDPIGFGLATATYTHSSGNVLKTSAFTSYVWTAGDQVYLASSTGAWSGLVEILSKTDADNIVVTPVTGGDDQTDVTSSDGPWTTIQFAADTVASNGSFIYICNDGTHIPTSRIDVDTNSFVIYYKGATARGVDDGTRATISAASLDASTDLFRVNISTPIFHNLRFTGGGGGRDVIISGTSNTVATWVHCRIDSAASDGVYHIVTSGWWTFVGCEIDSNSGNGLSQNAAARGPYSLVRCSVHDNGGFGCRTGANNSTVAIIDSLFYDNVGDGLYLFGTYKFIVSGCVCFGNGGDGIKATQFAGILSLSNCVFADNGGYGMNMLGPSYDMHSSVSCCSFNNTSGHFNSSDVTGDIPGTGHIYVDPEFESVVDGSEDFTPADGSPLIDIGISGPTA